MRTLLLIYNSFAGKGQVRPKLAAILDDFAQAGFLTTVWPTQGREDATQAAARLGGQYDRVVCSGGDGTLSEVVAGLLTLEKPPMLGYIPAGTTNDFSKNLHLPKGLEKAAAVAARGVPRACDMGRFNGKSFVYVAAFGAFTDVAYDTPQTVKNTFGHFAYILEGMSRLGNLKSYPLTVEHDGGVLEGDFIFGMVSNTISVGGFRGLPPSLVKLDDGLFEVVLVRTPKNPLELQNILVSFARQSPVEGGPVVGLHSARIKVTCGEPLPWTLDGEFGGDPLVAEIENLHKIVTLVCGK